MITAKVNSIGLNKVLAKSNTYANNEAGKFVENILRNIVTGEGADGLPQVQGMYRVALQNKPTSAKIENDLKKLKSAFVLQGKSKRMQRLTPKMREMVIRNRVARSGHTGRSLEYANWAEARQSRVVDVPSEKTDKTVIQLQTKGLNQKAVFRSNQGGVKHFQKTLGLATDAVAKTTIGIKQYIKKKFTQDIRRFLK